MRPVSDALLRAIRGSHRMVAEARVVAAGQTGTNPTGTTLRILGGDVLTDASARVRSTLSLTIDGTGVWPTSADDELTPYGPEVWVRRGVVHDGGSAEWVSLGYYRIEDLSQSRPPNGPIRITASDRMAGLVEARMLAPVEFATTATFGSVLETLVQEVYPWAVIEWDDSTSAAQVGRKVVCEEDRFAFLDDLVKSVGKAWAWDYRGVLTVYTPPSPTDPVWTVNHGASGVLVSMSRHLGRAGAYNAVVATGVATDSVTPVRGVAQDLNPHSPTYWHGDFGKVPRFYSSPLITTNAQAEMAASSLLQQAIGVPYSVDFSAVPNPALEPFDVVAVKYSDAHRTEIHVIDQLVIPLVADRPMMASTREQVVALT